MKKYILPIIVVVAFIVLLAYFYFNKFDFNNRISYNTQKLGTENLNNNNPTTSVESEKEISNFTTKIIDKDDNRDINMKITCNKINNFILKNGEEFSFNKVAGNPTPDRGYKEAGIIVNGELEKGYGGGNCQVSSTLYNAVKKVPSLKIIERHEHSNKVPYISKGKDAAVAYGGYDLKFKNDTGFDIMIKTEATASNITVSLIKL